MRYLICCALVGFAVSSHSCKFAIPQEPAPHPKPHTKPNTKPMSFDLYKSNHQVSKETGEPVGGNTNGPGLVIVWEGTQNERGASPLNVLKVVAERMTHLQSTPLKSDKQARALFSILEAIDTLESSQEVSRSVDAPGLPNPSDKDPSQ